MKTNTVSLTQEVNLESEVPQSQRAVRPGEFASHPGNPAQAFVAQQLGQGTAARMAQEVQHVRAGLQMQVPHQGVQAPLGKGMGQHTTDLDMRPTPMDRTVDSESLLGNAQQQMTGSKASLQHPQQHPMGNSQRYPPPPQQQYHPLHNQ